MSRYAENTKVPVDRSRAEIERTLQRYGADRLLPSGAGPRLQPWGGRQAAGPDTQQA